MDHPPQVGPGKTPTKVRLRRRHSDRIIVLAFLSDQHFLHIYWLLVAWHKALVSAWGWSTRQVMFYQAQTTYSFKVSPTYFRSKTLISV